MHTKYILPERSSDGEYMTHHKSNITSECKVFWCKRTEENTFIVFSNGAPIHTYGLGTFKFHIRGENINIEGRVSQLFQLLLRSNVITIPFGFFVKN